jgi:hypothetical protein
VNLSQLKISVFQFAESIFGTKEVRKIYTDRCIDIFRKFGFIFIHIPKSGGTSVAHAIYGKRAGHDKASVIKQRMNGGEYERMFSFSVVRNPYNRLVSAYHYATQGGGSEGGIRKRSVYSSTLFNSFSSFVIEWLIFQNPEDIELVFRPQYLFIMDAQENLLVKWLGRIEEKEEIETVILNELGLKIQLGQKNTSNRRGFQTYYTPELQALVYNFYKKDFELLGYSKEMPQIVTN